jgi:multiple sugar transport system permease protein
MSETLALPKTWVTGQRHRTLKRATRRVGVHGSLIVIVALFAAPYVWALSSSFKPESQLFTFPPQLIPHPITLSNYETLFHAYPFLTWLRNSVIISTLYTVGAVVSCSMAAYSFARLKWPGRNIMFGLTIASMILPYQVTMVPLYLIFRRFGWVDTWFPLWVPAWLGVPFYIFLLRQFFKTIPREIEEAARVDGASRLRVFFHVILPISKPALATVAVFAVLASWSDFIGPLIYIQSTNLMPLSLGLEYLNTSGSMMGQELYGVMMAGSVITLLPMLLVFLLLQRHFVRGITMGAIKG